MEQLVNDVKTQTPYLHINGAVNKTFMNRHPHELSPGHNLHKNPNVESWNPDAITRTSRVFPYVASLPTPLVLASHVENLYASYVEDPALQLVLQKEHWIKQKKKMNKAWKMNKALSRQCALSARAKHATCPQFLVDFAELLAADPDPYFNSTYDWYYTEGSLNIIEDNGLNILIRGCGIQDTFLDITPITKDGSRYRCDNNFQQSSRKLHNKKPIFQIISSKTCNNPLCIGVRQKNEFSLYIAKLEGLIYKTSTLKNIHVKENLTSANFNDFCGSSFCLADVDDNLTIYDLETLDDCRIINMDKDPNLRDKWSSVKFWDQHTLVRINRNSIHTVDIRSGDNGISLFKPDHISDKCDAMSSFKFSKVQQNLLYVGTNHSLFSYDTRMLKEIQPLQRWTHGMKSTPHLIDLGVINNEEIITLVSPLTEEVRFIMNNHSGKKKSDECEIGEKIDEIIIESLSLPWQPPTKSDTLILSKIHGHNLKPNRYLTKHMASCNSGISVICNDESIFVFVQNSLGDIFQQELRSTSKPFDNENVLEDFNQWATSITDDKNPLFATDMINLRPTFSILRNESSLKESAQSKKKVPEKWRRPVNELAEYKDVLAADLLSAWNVIDNVNENIPSQLHKSSTTTQEKVSAWLQSAPIGENGATDTFIPEPTNIPIESNTIFNSQPILPSCIPEPVIFSTQQINVKPKKTLQRKKYLDGF